MKDTTIFCFRFAVGEVRIDANPGSWSKRAILPSVTGVGCGGTRQDMRV